MVRRRGPAKQEMDPLAFDIAGIALCALSILIFIGLIRPEQVSGLGSWVADGLRYLFGLGAFVVPPMLVFLGVLSIVRRAQAWSRYRLTGVILLFISFMVLADLSAWEQPWGWDRYCGYGGLAGAVSAWLLVKMLSRTGTCIVVGALALISILMLFNLSLAALIGGLYDRVTAVNRKRRSILASTGKKAPKQKAGKEKAVSEGLPLIMPQPVEKPIQIRLMDDTDAAGPALPEGTAALSSAGLQERQGPAGRSSSADDEQMLSDVGKKPIANYELPAASLLMEGNASAATSDRTEIERKALLLEKTLEDFGISVKVAAVEQGPTITRYELQPAPGVKVNRIVNLSNDIALSLAASNIRIEAPIPGKSAVGVEVPNDQVSIVRLRELIETDLFRNAKSRITFALGKDIAGTPVVADLGRMPHLLIAGSTGTGKSVCINALIMSLLYRAAPSELKLVMIDPKRVELNIYEHLPHLAMPVIKDVKQAAAALKWVVRQMESRYELFASQGVRNIDGYNSRNKDDGLPYIVVIIDELADLMLVAPMDVENSICRLAQLARATGIHLVVATQRPSVDIITGTIKANISSRISFAVSSQIDSRTILDAPGAEKLMGRGDMLYQPVDLPKPIRMQGAFVTEEEIERVTDFIKRQGRTSYMDILPAVDEEDESPTDYGDADDKLFMEAVRQVINSGQASISMLQRRLKVGYARAARLVDMMEERGIVGPFEGSKARDVLVGPEYLEEQEPEFEG
ncbi:MAG: DNA translocase FtsK [bacterium]|nr:DNA translocase FtsK [bacterium]